MLWALLYLTSSLWKRINRVRKRLARRIFWNSWLDAVVESMLIVVLCVAISFKHTMHFDTMGEIVQSSFCIGCLLIYSLLPLFSLFKVLRNFNHIDRPAIKNSYGAFYENSSVKKGKKVLIFPTMQLIGRAYLVYIVIYGTQVIYYQLLNMMAVVFILGLLNY